MPEMASVTVTYGRKRGLLRSLGSHRPQKRMVASLPTKKPGSPAMRTPTARKASKRSPRKRTSRNRNSIDDMASIILDDSTLSIKDRDLGGTEKELLCQPESPLVFNSAEDIIKPPLHKNTSQREAQTRLGENHEPLENRTHSLRPEKLQPKNTEQVTRQTFAIRTRTGPRHKRRENNLQKPTPPAQALTFDPLRSHPIIKLEEDASFLPSKVDKNTEHRQMDGGVDTGVAIEHAAPEEINKKLHAMLAATNALKPSNTAANSPAIKLTRMVSSSKMFAKVSHAWDRLNPKSPHEDPKDRIRNGVQVSVEQESVFLKSEFSPLHTPPALSPISTIEIRLNEGDNLNKRKVQRIVGGQVARKPVADDGKSLRNGKFLDDPFSESEMARTPTSFETRLKEETEGKDSTPPIPRNPFESEKEFDNDIEDRILSITPVGSSTPRIRVHRVTTSGLDGSPVTRHLMATNPRVDSMLDGVAVKLGLEELTQARLLPFTSVRGSERRLVEPKNRVLLAAASNINPTAFDRVKKHPSPSKEALEDLEQAFRRYTRLRNAGKNMQEVDELATSFVSLTPPLPSRDKNRMKTNRLSVSNIDDLINPSVYRGHNRSRSSSPAIQFSKGPRPVGSAFKLHGEIRLAPPLRAAAPGINDVDELR